MSITTIYLFLFVESDTYILYIHAVYTLIFARYRAVGCGGGSGGGGGGCGGGCWT